MTDQPKSVSPEAVQQVVAEVTRELRALAETAPQRVDCNEENIERGLARLVLTLVEFLRQLLERQAIRRMEGGSLQDQQVEDMGLALMKLELKINEIAAQFGLRPEELNLDLGPLGRLVAEPPQGEESSQQPGTPQEPRGSS